ncbi:MAG: pyrimidine 5'-nucleotidase [Alphaproteobacteria bacterium]|jgi:putative hydrolase of the HAD superfamily|nr:pyrimidine 5'-nucleotidase [Alphaproteobacteria bacterium]HIA60218.1 pyrimidine 5'-nucleotidase [Pelagibacterales bacterium]
MSTLKNKISTWIFDLDNTLYSADSGIFQQVHTLMSKFVSAHLNIDIKKATELQRKYYRQHGTTLRGLMDNHNVDPDHFLSEVHQLDYSIVGPNFKLNRELKKLKGRKIIYTNANRQHANDVLIRLELTNVFDEIFDIKTANYIPKPEASPYEQIISEFNIDPITTIMFDDIAKNLVPAKNVGFASVWIDVGYENFSDDIAKSKKYLDYETKDLSLFLDEVNKEKI